MVKRILTIIGAIILIALLVWVLWTLFGPTEACGCDDIERTEISEDITEWKLKGNDLPIIIKDDSNPRLTTQWTIVYLGVDGNRHELRCQGDVECTSHVIGALLREGREIVVPTFAQTLILDDIRDCYQLITCDFPPTAPEGFCDKARRESCSG